MNDILPTLLFLAPMLLLLLFVSALYSAGETSLTAASRGRMHQLERDGDKAAKRVNLLLNDQEKMIGAVLLANNVLNIGASALTTSVLGALFPGAIGVAMSTLIMTILIVVFGEVLPKTLAILKPEDVARSLSRPVLWTVWALGPVIMAIQWLVRQTLRPFGVKLDLTTDVLAAHQELRGAIEYHHGEGSVESHDRDMFRGVLDLSMRDVSQIMVHRTLIAAVDIDQTIDQLISEVLSIGHTRIPFYKDNVDNIIGVLHVRELMTAMANVQGDFSRIKIEDILRTPWFIPDTTDLKAQLSAFLKAKNHFALVVDEYGALQGLVTLEDILEEIVGEIDDEHDDDLSEIQKQSDGGYIVDASMSVRDFNRALNWNLPEDLSVSLAGLVIYESGSIPDIGQVFKFYDCRFQILGRVNNQITRLKITKLPNTPL